MSLILVITNDGTGSDEVGHYDWQVRVNHRILSQGRFEGFNRGEGWHELLAKVAEVVHRMEPSHRTIETPAPLLPVDGD